MRVLLQRSLEASVSVDGEVVGAIPRGLVALVGTTIGDDEAIAKRLGERTASMRLFPDADGKTNLSVHDVGVREGRDDRRYGKSHPGCVALYDC